MKEAGMGHSVEYGQVAQTVRHLSARGAEADGTRRHSVHVHRLPVPRAAAKEGRYSVTWKISNSFCAESGFLAGELDFIQLFSSIRVLFGDLRRIEVEFFHLKHRNFANYLT